MDDALARLSRLPQLDDAALCRYRAAQDALRFAQTRLRCIEGYLASVPLRYNGARLSDLAQARQDALLAWCAPGQPWGLVLNGPPGRGKTFAAAALGYASAARGRSVTFASWAGWLASAKRSMDGGPGPVDLADFAGLVVLDDVGAGRLTDWAAGLLCEVVDAREADLARTVITTNCALPEFARVDGRLASRLSGARWLSFNGADLRPTTPAPLVQLDPPPPRDAAEARDQASAEAALHGLVDFDADLFIEAGGMNTLQRSPRWLALVPLYHAELARLLTEAPPEI